MASIVKRARINLHWTFLENVTVSLGRVVVVAAGTKRRSQVTGHRVQGTGHRSQVTGHRAQVTGHRAQGTGHRAQKTQ